MTKIEEFNPDDELPFVDGFEGPAVPANAYRAPLSPAEAAVRNIKIFAPAGIGLVLIVFGLTNSGSYYISSSRFGGVLADIFYGWQFGTFLAMIGTVLVYDAVKRTGYL